MTEAVLVKPCPYYPRRDVFCIQQRQTYTQFTPICKGEKPGYERCAVYQKFQAQERAKEDKK